MIFRPHGYQERAVAHIMEHPACALWLDMGLGKSVVTLTALRTLRDDYLEADRILVIAPKSVALNTWSGECAKWDHLKDLRVSVVLGTIRKREKALAADADVYVTSRDNVAWITGYYRRWPFDTVVLDEASSFKNFQSRRFKALWKVRPYIRRIIELTGTPAPNGYMDLWAQIKLLDNGERLGRFIGQYREAYFKAGSRSGSVVYSWNLRAGAGEAITGKLSDICLSMKAADYLKMPDLVHAGLGIILPEIGRYRQFEKDCILGLEDGTIEAATAVALTNKLLQFASGAVYDDEHTWHEVSTAKLEALDDLIEAAGGDPVLVFYNYQHERERILKEHPEAVPFKGESEILTRWNEGRIPVLLCHPASVAYGLNMQQGGHIIVWYSPTWDLELYQQANARLHRQGQTKPVMLYHITCRGTMDETVIEALSGKTNVQDALMRAVNELAKCTNIHNDSH